MIKLCCEYLSVRCNGLCVPILLRTEFRVNPHSGVVGMSIKYFFETCAISQVYLSATELEPTTKTTTILVK